MDARARLGLGILAAIGLASLIGPLFLPDPTLPVAPPLEPPSWAHLLGTTGQGQDVLAQTLVGARATLMVGFAAGFLCVVIGAIVGAVAGYVGGWVDDGLSLLTQVTLVVPGLPLAVLLAAWLPPGPGSLITALVATGWAWNARVIRSEVLTLRNREWVTAARLIGESPARIVLVELLPNLRPLLASALVGATVYAVGAQVGLEFLGLGDPGAVTWGTNLYWARNDAALLTRAWWTFVPTGLGIALVGLALALLNVGSSVVGAPKDTRVVRTQPLIRPSATFSPQAGRRPDGSMEAPIGHPTDDHALAPRSGERVPEGRVRGSEPTDTGAPLLDVRDLVIAYGADGPRAVDGVSLRLEAGEVLGLAGESGSGKSTLALGILRLLRPPALITDGEVRFHGRDLLSATEAELAKVRWRQAAVVLQGALAALNPVISIGQQLADTLRAHPNHPSDNAHLTRLLDRVGLGPEVLPRYAHQLSGGQRQRVCIAMALALSPELLILDEPTTALDVVVQRELLQRLLALREELGLAMIFVSHDLRLLFELSDRVGVLYAGRLSELGPARDMREAPAHPYTRGLLRAAPSLDGPPRPRAGIPGSPPDLRTPPTGCRFASRCPLAAPRCHAEAPPLHAVGTSWASACHAAPGLPSELVARGA